MGGFDCSHCTSTSLQLLIPVEGEVWLQSLHINFTATPDSWWGGSTAVIAHQLHCNSWFQWGGGGSTAVTAKLDYSHCTSTSLQLLILVGGLTAVTAKLDCSHCTSTSLQLLILGGGSTAVTAKLDCSHCTSTSLQLLILGGGGVQLQSLHINFTAAKVQPLINFCSPRGGGNGRPLKHSVRSTGWPLVTLTFRTLSPKLLKF